MTRTRHLIYSFVLAALTLMVAPAGQTMDQQRVLPAPLDASQGQSIGSVYEAYLSPLQEPGEERDAPAMTPKEFLSTAPSVDRRLRPARGYALLRFNKDLSKAYVDVKIENVKADNVVMFHIHCGKPDTLGPILIDFGQSGDLRKSLSSGTFSTVLSNEDIDKAAHAGHSAVSAFTSGCPVVPDQPMMGKVRTLAGMELIARHSELYFNLHTRGQTFFGEMRGQLHPVIDHRD